MNVDRLLAESLLENCVASRRGIQALLTFWRRFRPSVPARARIDDDSLDYLQSGGSFLRPTFHFDPVLNRQVRDPGPSNQDEIAALLRDRELWSQIEAILDTSENDLAVAALEALVNGPDRARLRPFYFAFAGSDPSRDDPVYVAYSASFYVPFLRHGHRRLT